MEGEFIEDHWNLIGDTLPPPEYTPLARIARAAADSIFFLEIENIQKKIWEIYDYLIVVADRQSVSAGWYEIQYTKDIGCLRFKSYRKYRKCMCNSIK